MFSLLSSVSNETILGLVEWCLKTLIKGLIKEKYVLKIKYNVF